jgi:hypothetical protein
LTLSGQSVYWTDNYAGIGRANLDGSGINYKLIPSDQDLRGVTAYGPYLYWGNAGTIGRANLNGSAVNQSFVPNNFDGTGPDRPYSVAVDGQFIYWADYGANSIGRANIDGSNSDDSFIPNADPPSSKGGPYAVAVTGQHIYWTTNVGTIAEANIDGSGVNLQFIHVDLGPGYVLAGLAVGPTAAQGASTSTKCSGKSPPVSRCVVPRLVGKQLPAAKTALIAAHCRLGNVTTRKALGASGRVLSQKPRPGTKLPARGKVSVVVSRR